MTLREPSKPIRPLRVSAATHDERAVATLLSLVPDPTPDRQFLERTVRGLVGRRPRRSLALAQPLTAAVGTALAGMALAAWLLWSPTRAEILLVEGTVSTGAAGMSWVPARPGQPLRPGAIVENVGDARSFLRLAGVAAVLLESGTELELESLDRATLLHLTRGGVTLRVTKRPREHAFALRAGGYTVTVLGTLFTVTRSTDGRVAVSVAEGTVRVSGMDGEWRVAAGERWSSDAPARRSPFRTSPQLAPLMEAALRPLPEGRLTELLHALQQERMSEPQPSSQAALAPTRAVVPPARGLSSEPEVKNAGVVPAEAPRDVSSTRQEKVTRVAHGSRMPVELAVTERSAPAQQPLAEPTAPAGFISESKPSPAAAPTYEHDLYAEAVLLERRGDHREAAAKLEAALASRSGPGDLELYHLALLRQRHLDDPQGALDALLSYRKGFPAGTLRQEVDLSIIETRLALGQTEQVLAESASFLSRYAKSERADEIHFMRGDLLRRRGDCAGALAEYHAVSREPVVDDAVYYSAYCLRELGESEAAMHGLEGYLQRFPEGKHVRAAREALGNE